MTETVDKGAPVEEVVRHLFVGLHQVQGDDKGGGAVGGEGAEVGVVHGVVALLAG